MTLLESLINQPHHQPRLVVFQSSSSQSSLPVLREFVCKSNSTKRKPCRTLIFCLLYSSSSIIETTTTDEDIDIHDWRDNVPGYTSATKCLDIRFEVEKASSSSTYPLTVVIDSIDTLLSDLGSLSKTTALLQELLSQISLRQDSSLLLHGNRTDLLSLVIQTSFSSSLAHIKAYPPVLVKHLATEYLMPPPPLAPAGKFWGLFLPLSQREREIDNLVFRNSGEGTGDPIEAVIEVLVRGVDGIGKKRGVERVIEGWSVARGACEWNVLESLKSIWMKLPKVEPNQIVDPTQNLSFNLSLTTSQQESRAQVPLPYAHEGQPLEKKLAAIFYDPDSADDIDDDDPDEDLDV